MSEDGHLKVTESYEGETSVVNDHSISDEHLNAFLNIAVNDSRRRVEDNDPGLVRTIEIERGGIRETHIIERTSD